MAVYRFKIYFEDDETIIREVDIKSTQTFENFHTTIQGSIGFDGAHPTSFFVSSEGWRKGKEIILLHKHSKGLKGTWMHETKIATYVEDPRQKFVYEFDPEGGNWILLIELMKIIPEASVTYPRINKSVGIAPPQYKVTSADEILPVEEEEDETAVIVDDSEDRYIHPEAVEHFGAGDDDGPIPHMVVKEVAVEMADEEAIEEETGDGEAFDEEDESAEQHEEEFE